jgi:hypothetical protein
MKTIQLKGAALEAALKCRAISDEHDKERKRIIQQCEADMEKVCEITRDEMSAQLAIIEQQSGVSLRDQPLEGTMCQLDLRYVALGLAFVNVDDKKEGFEALVSQLLS